MYIEAMKQALEALEEACEIIGAAWTWRDEKGRPAITSLRQAIEQAEKQEPVAWSRASFIEDDDGRQIGTDEPEISWGKEPPDEFGWSPLYTTPQPQEFVCSTGLCHFTLTQTNVGIGEQFRVEE